MSGIEPEKTVSTRTMELIVAGLFMIAASVVMYDSWRIGAGWSDSGPQSGFFPFYIGLFMLISGTAIFLTQLASRVPGGNFVERARFWQVLQMLLPTAVFVFLIGFLGLYLASAIFLAFFMAFIGRYPLLPSFAAGGGVALFLFLLFEKAFLIPLPKGPLEAALGY